MSSIVTQISPWSAKHVKMFFLRNLSISLKSLVSMALASIHLET